MRRLSQPFSTGDARSPMMLAGMEDTYRRPPHGLTLKACEAIAPATVRDRYRCSRRTATAPVTSSFGAAASGSVNLANAPSPTA